MTDLFLFAISNLMIFYIEKADLEEMTFNNFFKIILLLKDSKSKNCYPKKLIFLLDKFYDLENFFLFYENFKKQLKENWTEFLKEVKYPKIKKNKIYLFFKNHSF